MLALVQVAEQADLRVRTLASARVLDSGLPTSSASCRVRGEIWIVLDPEDPVDVRVAVLVDALKAHRGEWLQGHWLPPAVRERLD